MANLLVERVNAMNLIDVQASRTFVLDWIRDGLTTGMSVEEAAEDALGEVLRTGQAPALLKALGSEPLVRLWRAHGELSTSHSSPSVEGQKRERPHRRRVDTALLRQPSALLEAMYTVAGKQRRLGDMTYEDCRSLQREHAKLASFFGAVADGLEGGQRVAERFDEDKIRAIYDKAASL
jgi:hypothetical protein